MVQRANTGQGTCPSRPPCARVAGFPVREEGPEPRWVPSQGRVCRVTSKMWHGLLFVVSSLPTLHLAFEYRYGTYLMLDVSLGQLIVVGVVGAAVTGRKDLPHAFRFVGTQVGRIVGLLQGARARADQYAAQNELKQLQNELRSGVRELDQVRMELAVAASSQGMVGRNLGALTSSANRPRVGMVGGMSTFGSPPFAATAASAAMSPPNLGYNTTVGADLLNRSTTLATPTAYSSPLMPRGVSPSTTSMSTSHSEKAALEEEWEKQGIGYQTRAEQLYKERRKKNNNNNHNGRPTAEAAVVSGSELLESLIRQQLLWDQYDRVVAEQNSHIQSRIDARTTSTSTTTSDPDGSAPEKTP